MSVVRIYMTEKDGEPRLISTFHPDEDRIIMHGFADVIDKQRAAATERVKNTFEDIARQDPASVAALLGD